MSVGVVTSRPVQSHPSDQPTFFNASRRDRPDIWSAWSRTNATTHASSDLAYSRSAQPIAFRTKNSRPNLLPSRFCSIANVSRSRSVDCFPPPAGDHQVLVQHERRHILEVAVVPVPRERDRGVPLLAEHLPHRHCAHPAKRHRRLHVRLHPRSPFRVRGLREPAAHRVDQYSVDPSRLDPSSLTYTGL